MGSGEGGVFDTPLSVFLLLFVEDKTSAPEVSFIPRAHLGQVKRRTVTMVTRYDVISSRWSSHF